MSDPRIVVVSHGTNDVRFDRFGNIVHQKTEFTATLFDCHSGPLRGEQHLFHGEVWDELPGGVYVFGDGAYRWEAE